MEAWVAIVGVLVAATAFVSWVNRRHDARREREGRTPDARVAEAWDAHGLAGEDDPQAHARFGALLAAAPAEELQRKASLVQLAVMGIRAKHYEGLPDLAERARVLDAGCGETAALVALGEAYAGDPARALPLLARARATLAGCASCGGGVDATVLAQEVAIALDALASGERGAPAESEGAGERGA